MIRPSGMPHGRIRRAAAPLSAGSKKIPVSAGIFRREL